MSEQSESTTALATTGESGLATTGVDRAHFLDPAKRLTPDMKAAVFGYHIDSFAAMEPADIDPDKIHKAYIASAAQKLADDIAVGRADQFRDRILFLIDEVGGAVLPFMDAGVDALRVESDRSHRDLTILQAMFMAAILRPIEATKTKILGLEGPQSQASRLRDIARELRMAVGKVRIALDEHILTGEEMPAEITVIPQILLWIENVQVEIGRLGYYEYTQAMKGDCERNGALHFLINVKSRTREIWQLATDSGYTSSAFNSLQEYTPALASLYTGAQQHSETREIFEGTLKDGTHDPDIVTQLNRILTLLAVLKSEAEQRLSAYKERKLREFYTGEGARSEG
jgi:hypothetical protein